MHSSSSPAEETVDFREYIAVLRRRWRLIVAVVATLVAMTAAYSFTQTPMYTATAVVLVQPSVDSTQFRPDQLVSLDTEARIVKSAPVASLAGDKLGSTLRRPELLKRVDVGVTPDTLVLDISYTDPNPRQAAAGANAFANAYLEFKTQQATDAAATKRTDINQKIDELETELKTLEGAEPGSADDQRAQFLTAQIGVLTTELASVAPVGDPGQVILPAIPPLKPSSPKLLLNLAMGFMLGIFLGVVLAFIRDRTDDRITDLEDLELTIEFPVVSTIPHAAGVPRHEEAWLITERQPRSPAAEAFRTLRTSVIALGRQRGLKSLAIVSAAPGDGKTTVCANLGVSLSHTDSRVLLIAADLRRPTLARSFGADLDVGTADVLTGEATLTSAVKQVSPNLWLMTSGQPPERPAELLQSPRLAALLAEARERFDFVLIDCPAVMGLADTLAVAPFADGSILIARVESSKRAAIARAVERVEQVGGRFIGAVLNDVPLSKRTAEYGYGYGYKPEADRRGGEASPRVVVATPAPDGEGLDPDGLLVSEKTAPPEPDPEKELVPRSLTESEPGAHTES